VPAKIQDLIERNIRTLSNSISAKNIHSQVNGVMDDLKDLKEMWLTKKEQEEFIESPKSKKQIDDKKNGES